MDLPETRYARSGDVNIAYQVTGQGPFDLVLVPGFVNHVEIEASVPGFAAFLDQFASFSRLIRFDKRGTGMSDPISGAPTLEARMDDVRAVMDAVGSRRAAFYGLSERAAMCLLFAATYPERTAALAIRSAYPRRMWAPDYPWGFTEEAYEGEVERDLRIFGPFDQARDAVGALGRFDDTELKSALDMFRFGSSPGSLEALHRMNMEIDVRHVLSGGARADADPARVGGYDRSGRSRSLHGLADPHGADRRDPGGRTLGPHKPWGRDRRGGRMVPQGRVGGGRLGGARAGSRSRHRSLYRYRRLDREGDGAWRPCLARASGASPRPDPPRTRALPWHRVGRRG
jgi:pimeloyl-ACP methyl ester carboxylesterase